MISLVAGVVCVGCKRSTTVRSILVDGPSMNDLVDVLMVDGPSTDGKFVKHIIILETSMNKQIMERELQMVIIW